jgi:hypothetical protein
MTLAEGRDLTQKGKYDCFDSKKYCFLFLDCRGGSAMHYLLAMTLARGERLRAAMTLAEGRIRTIRGENDYVEGVL